MKLESPSSAFHGTDSKQSEGITQQKGKPASCFKPKAKLSPENIKFPQKIPKLIQFMSRKLRKEYFKISEDFKLTL